MKKTSKSIITTFLTLSVVLMLGASAFGVVGDKDITTVTVRRDNNRDPRFVRIQGELMCSYGNENNGGPCIIKLKDVRTGKTFDIKNGRQAMQILNEGTKMVSIEGSLMDSQTIAIDRINAL